MTSKGITAPCLSAGRRWRAAGAVGFKGSDMKRSVIKKIAVIILFALLSTMSAAEDKSEIQSFVADFKAAVEANDMASINSMNSWKGVPGELRTVLEGQFKEVVTKGILSIDLRYIENGDSVKFNRRKQIFAPNVRPLAKINIEIPKNGNFRGGYSFYIGKENGSYLFSHVVRQQRP